MTDQTRRYALSGILLLFMKPAWAAPRTYLLDTGKSRITFYFWLNDTRQSGTLPIHAAVLNIDPQRLETATADVSADVSRIKTGFLPITQTIKGPALLDAKNHPLIRFRSTRVNLGARGRISEGASIEGDVTLRGVTRPLRLNALLTRPAGSDPNDLSRLSITLTGAFSRRDFGITGFGDLVADRIELDIRAEIQARSP